MFRDLPESKNMFRDPSGGSMVPYGGNQVVNFQKNTEEGASATRIEMLETMGNNLLMHGIIGALSMEERLNQKRK